MAYTKFGRHVYAAGGNICAARLSGINVNKTVLMVYVLSGIFAAIAGNYNEPECAPWRDILYGSDKQLFWYCDPYMRACVNMDQGGACLLYTSRCV